MLCIMAFWMLISSTSCSLTQEVSPDLDKTSVVAVNPISMELDQIFAWYAIQSGLFESLKVTTESCYSTPYKIHYLLQDHIIMGGG